jgi:ADP-ribose pyrophosphatase
LADGTLPRVLESRRIYDGHVLNLRVDTVVTTSGTHEWEVVEHSGAVVVIAMPSPDEMVLVRQYRHPLARMTWEVCAGGIDPGETPHDAALRELREETGFRASRMRSLWSAYSAPGFCSELLHFFVTDAWDVGATDFDPGEDIEIATFSIGRLREMIERDELPDAKTQISVLWALTARSTA